MSTAIERAPARVTTPSPDLLSGLAQRVVADQQAFLPDLAHVVVVVPGMHAAGAVAVALRAAAGTPSLLLPRITTLAQWADDMVLREAELSPAAREALLYRELTGRKWLRDADLWAISAELGVLFDDLTLWHVGLPASIEEFTQRLEAAYRARRGISLGFEARLVHDLWHVLARDTAQLDPASAFVRRLARLAQAAESALYALEISPPAPGEREFYERYAARAPVTIFTADDAATSDPVACALRAAWPRETTETLALRAADLRALVPESPLAARLRIIAVAGAEREAQAVDALVREWLLAGRQRIAVVVADRIVARRARALLERAQVLVADETGWALSTTSAATAVGRLLDVVANDGYHRDLLDLMKSPFAFHDLPRELRQRAVWCFEQGVRRRGTIFGVNAFLAAAAGDGDAAIRAMLERLASACRVFARRRQTLAGWLSSLDEALIATGIAAGLQADAAGMVLLELLDELRGELARDPLQVDFGEWRRWLARKIEGTTFRDRSIASQVVFTHLAATPLRSFDGVVIAGGDAMHLPGPDPLAMFFNQNVRGQLGLPTRADELREIEAHLVKLVAAADAVAVTWQRTRDGEENLLSPLLQRLETLHRCAWGTTLVDHAFEARLADRRVRSPLESELPPPSVRPRPAAPAPLIPSSISASGYNALMACPYQYHARYVLGLGELDEVQEQIEKADYGQRVHEILARFHRAHPDVSALGPDVATGALVRYSEQAFRDVIAANLLDAAWLARWKALIPEYVQWHLAREAEGWRFGEGEVRREIEIVTPRGHKLRLRGQLDRVDVREAAPGAVAPAVVIDYKTRSRRALQEALAKPGEDVQLPVYAMLWGGPVAAALFLSIDRDGVEEVSAGEDISEVADAVRTRLAVTYDALHEGAPLPAQGTDTVCEYCEMRGLCRRNFWS